MRRGVFYGRANAIWMTLVATFALTSVGVFGQAGSGVKGKTGAELKALINDGRARNVILFIGDGMGDSEITVARNYEVGANGRLTMDSLPFTGSYTTYALEENEPAKVDYVTDSAASGTGWATGTKTSNGRISTPAGSTELTPLVTILELAQRAGLKVGNVSTAELTDATPAVLMSHINSRVCQGPADMLPCSLFKKENDGPGSIAEQAVEHDVDVMLGGGRLRFLQMIDGGPFKGKTVVDQAKERGYEVIGDAAGLGAVKPGKKVLGLFSDGNMTLEWGGQRAELYPGSGPQSCIEHQRERGSKEPSLAEMTAKAIELLQTPATAKAGFFLQVEGASIDKSDHAENPCGQIGETITFDAAIKVGLEFAKTHPDTLIVVTADHGHTSQIVDTPRPGELLPRPGALSTLLTKEGSSMTINYATRLHMQSQDHTGTQVRIAAQGPQAFRVLGITNQTDLFHTITQALGIAGAGAGSKDGATTAAPSAGASR
jgi:alkaline phosphatase